MTMLLHISTLLDWQAAQTRSHYRTASLDSEGFIHCSTRDQLVGVANALYRGQTGLMLLVIDPKRVPAEIRYEDCYETGQAFPHVYGPIPLVAVIRAVSFPPDADGRFRLPPGLV